MESHRATIASDRNIPDSHCSLGVWCCAGSSHSCYRSDTCSSTRHSAIRDSSAEGPQWRPEPLAHLSDQLNSMGCRHRDWAPKVANQIVLHRWNLEGSS